MKRLLVLALAAFGFGAATFAGNSNATTTASSSNSFIYRMNDATTFNGIANFLKMSYQQKDIMQYVFSEAEKVMREATEKGASAKEAVEKAIYFNLGNAREVLSREQYIKFVGLINLTVYNDNNGELFSE